MKKQKTILEYVQEARTQKNEAKAVSDRRIDFETFGGCIDIYAGATIDKDDKPVAELGLNSSSRGSINFYMHPKEYDGSFTELDRQAQKDRKEIINALKSICNDFDNKIKALLKSKGYEMKK